MPEEILIQGGHVVTVDPSIGDLVEMLATTERLRSKDGDGRTEGRQLVGASGSQAGEQHL
jgi:hypothetical protein